MAEGLLALAAGGHIFIILDRRMNNAPLIRIHRLQGNRASCPLNLIGNVLCQGFQCLFSSLSVVFRVKLNS